MKYSFNKKIIAITGAANGIGRAAAILLAREDATIIAIDKDKKGLNKLKLKLKNKISCYSINGYGLDNVVCEIKYVVKNLIQLR